jgi:hypothetical protein
MHGVLERPSTADERYDREPAEMIEEHPELLASVLVVGQSRADDGPVHAPLLLHHALALALRAGVGGSAGIDHRGGGHEDELFDARRLRTLQHVPSPADIHPLERFRVLGDEDGCEMKDGIHPVEDARQARGIGHVAVHQLGILAVQASSRPVQDAHSVPLLHQPAHQPPPHDAGPSGHQDHRSVAFHHIRWLSMNTMCHNSSITSDSTCFR